MKKIILPSTLLLLLAACRAKSDSSRLEARIDSLQQQINNAYKPGFGEFMSGIQMHHAKLWFAGINSNWELADFEIGEIKESVDDLEKYETSRPETKSLPVLMPALDSVSHAVELKDVTMFKRNYVLLTNTCNQCHRAVQFSFNEVQIPSTPPVSNQVFEKKSP